MNKLDATNFSLESLGSGAPKRQAVKELGQEQFLDLMVAQLRNQDPLKPMQNGEFLGQLAQFGTVNGIQELQKTFTEMASSFQSNQALMASSMVGRSVLINGDSATLPAGGNVQGAMDLPGPAANVNVGIYDASGQLVRSLPLGAQAAGRVNFTWDGVTDRGSAAAPGRYVVKAEGLTGNQRSAYDTMVLAKVDSVSLGGASGMTLNLAGLGAIALGDVKEIR
jgi:flagellar basal-body rod modification protein FlgD